MQVSHDARTEEIFKSLWPLVCLDWTGTPDPGWQGGQDSIHPGPCHKALRGEGTHQSWYNWVGRFRNPWYAKIGTPGMQREMFYAAIPNILAKEKVSGYFSTWEGQVPYITFLPTWYIHFPLTWVVAEMVPKLPYTDTSINWESTLCMCVCVCVHMRIRISLCDLMYACMCVGVCVCVCNSYKRSRRVTHVLSPIKLKVPSLWPFRPTSIVI